MAEVSVTFTNTFEDGTTDSLTINHVQSSAITNIKPAVKMFNSTIGETDFPNRLVSKSGAKWKRISGVDITVTNKVYLF